MSRTALLLLAAALATYVSAWACAAAATWATPSTGLTHRAPWIDSRTRDRTVLHVVNTTSEFTLFETRGRLARSTALQWAVTSFNLEEPPATLEAAADVSAHLPDTLDAHDRARFRAWLESLCPVPGAPMAILEEDSFGFPLHGLSFSMRTDYGVKIENGTRTHDPFFSIAGGIDASALTPYRTPRPALVLPLIPRWPEFLANTAFWAVILLAIHPGIAVVRRHFRQRRGLCPRCGYDLRTLAGASACPECGTAATMPIPRR